ncbi:hypothetical protein ACFLWJ_01595 [Chloroflexota bacterium]
MVRSFRSSIHRFWTRLKRYFSGKLFVVQLSAGIGAFALRTLLAYLFRSDMVSSIIAGLIGSYTGYIGTYAFGYWLRFRKDYRVSGRSIRKDILGLQSAEQLPNVTTLIISIAWQGLFIQATGLPTWVGVNLASWFGPHKFVNLGAALFSNSLKRGWIDGSWLAPLWIRRFLGRVKHFGRSVDNADGEPDIAETQSVEVEVVDGE